MSFFWHNIFVIFYNTLFTGITEGKFSSGFNKTDLVLARPG
jgi:hypothetical protein